MPRPSYKKNDPVGWGGDRKRGPALGRFTIHNAPADFTGKIYLREIKLNSEGYDRNGTYFGHGGDPIWWYASSDNQIDAVTRAPNREQAIEEIKRFYPKAKF